MTTVDDPTLRELLTKHQEGMAGASALSLFASMSYAVLKNLSLRRAVLAAGLGTLFAASGYLFLSEYLKWSVIFVVPIGLAAGFGAYPILKAYTDRDGTIAEWLMAKLGLKDKP